MTRRDGATAAEAALARPAGAWRIAMTAALATVAKAATVPLLAAAGLLVASAATAGAATVERRLGLMGTSLVLEVEAADRATALAASERAVAALEAAEARLSTWRQDTELARLNRATAGEPFALSPALAADLAAARRCWEETDGAFDPTVGPLVRAWGLREGGRSPSAAEVARALEATGMEGLRLASAPSAGGTGIAVRMRGDLLLEEGGFGKGAGLRDVLAALAAITAALTAPGIPANPPALEAPVTSRAGTTADTPAPTVAPPASLATPATTARDALAVPAGAGGVSAARLNLGGQVALLGHGRERVAVADPRRRDRMVIELAVEGGSVSTSGNSERGIVAGGKRLGHLLDPRTGRPAPDFGSLTVWAADPLRADCLSTGLYVLGPEKAMAWTAAHPDVAVLALEVNGGRIGARASANLRGRLTPLAPGIEVLYAGAGMEGAK